ncbi:MAG: CoA transferase, partial [Actinomycetota bacterium]
MGTARPGAVLDPGANPAFGPRRSLAEPHAPDGLPAPDAGASIGRRRPLDGVRVLDLSWVWAGPYGAMHLAHLGAEVIKVESALRPGLGRRLPIHPPELEPTLNTSAYFNQWEQGKLSCQLDLSQPEAVELVKAMVATCDVVIENFATGVMERLGLGYDVLQEIRPDIIVASISGYGSDGPLSNFMGYGPTTGPLSGLTSLTGYEGGPPRELGISIGDPAAGITAAMAVTAALVARRAGGGGAYIDVALWEATASCAVEGWMAHELTEEPPRRMGNRDPLLAPHNCYRTADEGPSPADEPDPGRWIAIACGDDEQWRQLAALIDEGLVDDPR